jgi:hypothetical protein
VRYLLAFGTENYLDESQGLPQVPAELDTIVALFTRNGYQEQLTELRHDPAAHDLKQALETWLLDDALKVDGIVVIYYTGHGFTHLGRHYLATADTRLGSPSSALKAEELVEVIESSPSVRRVLLILDVCYAEAGALDAAQVAARHPASTGPSAPGQGIWLIASSRRREEASQAAFSTAFAEAVTSAITPSIQQYHALEALMEGTNRILGDRQQAGFVTGTVATGLAPFIANPAFDPLARPGDDLETASRRHKDVRTRFDPKARGVDVVSQEGRYFRGRGEATEWILNWLGADATGTRVCVVTGQPGAGKSALLGHVLFLSNPELRSDTQPSVVPRVLRAVRSHRGQGLAASQAEQDSHAHRYSADRGEVPTRMVWRPDVCRCWLQAHHRHAAGDVAGGRPAATLRVQPEPELLVLPSEMTVLALHPDPPVSNNHLTSQDPSR